MIEVMLLAIALSMDAFAVSIGLGTKNTHQKFTLSILAGLYFGIFQGVMPLIGYLGGVEVFAWVEVYAVLIASLLIVFVGGKMIYEALSTDIESDTIKITHKVMLVLAIATSIDALAAGFSLTILDFNPFIACFIIAFTTFMFSFLGVYIGAKSGGWLESKAELFGGIVLILLGLKLLLV